ncbi:MAG: CBS domain-containing protein [Acetobacteraceae bacterium]|nr:CBS domain-containing protein [Acetobacteraceae bacterium]
MLARDIMTRDLVTVTPDAPIAMVAAIMAERGVSGLPVVASDGRLCGLVTESDLLRRVAATRDRAPGWLSGLFGDAGRLARDYARSHGTRARDVMTVHVTSIPPEAAVEDAAALLERLRVRRLPVVEDGKLLGLVSRADILKAVLEMSPPEPASADDRSIREELRRRLAAQPWADRNFLHVAVQGGAVKLSGFARNDDVARAMRVLAEGVPGVRTVELDLAPPPPFMLGVG